MSLCKLLTQVRGGLIVFGENNRGRAFADQSWVLKSEITYVCLGPQCSSEQL